MGHYIIIGIVVVLIIGVQIYFFSKTLKEIRMFSNIFPKSTDNLYAHNSEIYIGNKKSDNEQIDKNGNNDKIFHCFGIGLGVAGVSVQVVDLLLTISNNLENRADQIFPGYKKQYKEIEQSKQSGPKIDTDKAFKISHF